MFDVLSPHDYVVYRKVFATVYLLWSALWFQVLIHYGHATRLSWIHQGGTWRNALSDLTAPFRFAWTRFFCWCKIIEDMPELCDGEMPSRFSIGHHLRFSIFLASCAPTLLGSLYFAVDRSHWSYIAFWFNMFVIMVSCIAAGGHLFIAFRYRPTAWTVMVILSSFWILAAPWAFIWLGWP